MIFQVHNVQLFINIVHFAQNDESSKKKKNFKVTYSCHVGSCAQILYILLSSPFSDLFSNVKKHLSIHLFCIFQVLSLIGFVAVLAGGWTGSGFVLWTTITAFITTTILFVIISMNIYSRLPGFWPLYVRAH